MKGRDKTTLFFFSLYLFLSLSLLYKDGMEAINTVSPYCFSAFEALFGRSGRLIVGSLYIDFTCK
jgi:hypothetical protein